MEKILEIFKGSEFASRCKKNYKRLWNVFLPRRSKKVSVRFNYIVVERFASRKNLLLFSM